MNTKGQFSIIAALLVAIVLIGTVIVTYSTIRNSPIQSHPQVLSAIDETNFAIKKILGFTVGYYGSVLKITGNTSYAQTLAINYLQSGLVNIANMHPERGVSFKVNTSQLYTQWFAETSYSTGNLGIKYNLTGLGIYGITYETSCRLTVKIGNTPSNNQTELTVTKDEGEPLIDLGREDFKFYEYEYSNSTWGLVTPTVEPTAYANGTYVIEIPTGVDPYSYFIQVEDSRGLVVVASSFSQYICTPEWNSLHGYRVQQGRTLVTATQQDIVISEVSSLNRAFVMFNHYYSSGQRDRAPSNGGNLDPDTGLVSAYLVDTTHVRVTRHSSTYDIYIDWQVVECLDGEFEVYRGSYDWDASDGTSFSANVGATVTPANCLAWVSGTTTSQNSREAYDTTLFRAYVSSPTQITIQRNIADANTDGTLRWVVVEFDTSGIDSIQTGTTTVTDSHTQSNPRQVVLGTSIDTSDSILLFQIGVADSGLDQCSVAGRIADSTTIEFYTHGANSQSREIRYYAIDFGSDCESKQSGTIDYSGDSNWYDHDETLNPPVTANRTLSFISLTQHGSGTAFPRPFPNAYIETSTNYNIWRSRYGQEAWIEWQVLELPYSQGIQSQEGNIVVELLQNGTMRWLGQSLQLTTQAKPIPPIPVKAIHINQTINGVDREVPFQTEDWASNYRIPLGLTNNASVFNSRTMLVFLVNPDVSEITLWWNGSDTATQTSYAYVNRYFTGDDPTNEVLTNGILTLDIITSGSDFEIRSTLGTSENTARFMRINGEWSIYGADPAYVIHHGIVRDIIHQEAEWSGGANNCPNLYAHIVLTLPANATYYTYQLRLMFVESQQDRTITDLCPIRIETSTGLPQTENGTANGYPETSDRTGLFYNSSTSSWQHHWSQFISGTRGSGIMFSDTANQMLYLFDFIGGDKTGALEVSNSTERIIELLPVTMTSVEFEYALDVTWHGAVVTFDDTTPIYKDEGDTETGLWITVEHPPAVTVTTES